jgi:HlyD family secretion protein
VSIVTSRAANTVAVPIQCVVERVPGKKADEQDEDAPKKKYVLLVRDGKVKLNEVQTGISDATHVAITSGVRAGEELITGPFRTLKKLNDGDAVQITKEETQTSTDEDNE